MKNLGVLALTLLAALPALATTVPTAPVPEPATFLLVGGGIGALYLIQRRRSRRK